MAVLKCKMCGGALELSAGETVAECPYCGTKQTVPNLDDDRKAQMFDRANRLRAACSFDRALAAYENIIASFPEEAEAYWGELLCKYGIEYVDDPATGKKIPTCHRSSYESVLDDEAYEMTMEYASPSAKQVYREEAKSIEEIRKGIIAVSAKEEPYDIFICYKETDDNGDRSIDSVLAQDVYEVLTEKGYRVFFSRISLEDKIGKEYEPYIFAALNSAKVMLVFGTERDHFNAVWVKNEWSRFLDLMSKDKNKTLIPCYKNIDAYDLPKEFTKLQAQDMGKVGAIQDLIRGIGKLVRPNNNEKTIGVTKSDIEPLLKRIGIFLEDGDFKAADEYCEKALDIDPENANAYLGKLMAQLNVKKADELKNCSEPFDNLSNYQKAVRYGDKKLSTTLQGYVSYIKKRNEKERIEGIYNKATDQMHNAGTENEFKTAAKQFSSISEYQDAKMLAEECLNKADACRKDAIYAAALSQMTGTAVNGYEAAIKTFNTISGWKDTDDQIYACQRKIEEIKAKEEIDRLERERHAEQKRIAAENATKKRKKIITISVLIAVVCIAFWIVLKTIIIPNSKYNKAKEMIANGNYDAAYDLLSELNGFKDSESLRKKTEDSIRIERYSELFENAEEGNYVKFGTYEQDNDELNEKESIEWLVLKKEEDRLLLISRYGLDCEPYSDTYINVTWESCSLRTWLNENFIDEAFPSNDQLLIPFVTVSADSNPVNLTSSGNATTDKVFLLSISEAEKYFKNDDERKTSATAYANSNGAYKANNGNCRWWLRTPSGSKKSAAIVIEDGKIDENGSSVDSSISVVRPALWVSKTNE